MPPLSHGDFGIKTITNTLVERSLNPFDLPIPRDVRLQYLCAIFPTPRAGHVDMDDLYYDKISRFRRTHASRVITSRREHRHGLQGLLFPSQ